MEIYFLDLGDGIVCVSEIAAIVKDPMNEYGSLIALKNGEKIASRKSLHDLTQLLCKIKKV